jgi:hypothetical protein
MAFHKIQRSKRHWTPAFAGVTDSVAGVTDSVAGVTETGTRLRVCIPHSVTVSAFFHRATASHKGYT